MAQVIKITYMSVTVESFMMSLSAVWIFKRLALIYIFRVHVFVEYVKLGKWHFLKTPLFNFYKLQANEEGILTSKIGLNFNYLAAIMKSRYN